MAGKNVTAFVLDPEHVQASEDGMTVPPLPGLWRNDVAIHPAALGLTLAEMRDLVEALSLPLVEVTVSESKARQEFPAADYLMPSGPLTPIREGGLVSAEPSDEPVTAGDEQVPPEELDTTRAELAAAEVESEGEES